MGKKQIVQSAEPAADQIATTEAVEPTVPVIMLQCMAGMERTLEVGACVEVPQYVADAWVEAGIATIKVQ